MQADDLMTKDVSTAVGRRAPPSARNLYRAELPLMALAYRDDHHAAITIPSGKLIRVIGPAEDDRFLVIEMDGEQFQAFETDLKNRCSVHAERGPAKASLSANASF